MLAHKQGLNVTLKWDWDSLIILVMLHSQYWQNRREEQKQKLPLFWLGRVYSNMVAPLLVLWSHQIKIRNDPYGSLISQTDISVQLILNCANIGFYLDRTANQGDVTDVLSSYLWLGITSQSMLWMVFPTRLLAVRSEPYDVNATLKLRFSCTETALRMPACWWTNISPIFIQQLWFQLS